MKNKMLLAALLALLLAAFAPPVLAQPDDGNFVLVDPRDVYADCDLPLPEYRELCLERGYEPVEIPKRTPEEEAVIEARARAQAEEKGREGRGRDWENDDRGDGGMEGRGGQGQGR